MKQNAKRNLQRRKRHATRLAKREYFKKKKEAPEGGTLNRTSAG
jgi:hypothetical protein